jgi:hypothetical protein
MSNIQKIRLVFLPLILMCFLSCTTIRYVPIETIKTEYIDRYHRDSIHTRDSIYVTKWFDSDTVWMYEYRDRFVYRDVFKIDSIIKVDSIPYPVEVIKDKIIYKTKWYENIMIYGFFILLAIF